MFNSIDMDDFQIYLDELLGTEGLQHAFSDINVSSASASESADFHSDPVVNALCSPSPQNVDDPIDLNWLFGDGSENNNATDLSGGSYDFIQEYDDPPLPRTLSSGGIISDELLMMHSNSHGSPTSTDALFDQLNSTIVPQPSETSIVQGQPAAFVEVSSETLSHEADPRHPPPLIDTNMPVPSVSCQYNFDLGIQGEIYVKEQPQADLRARYGSDGDRFLPGSRKTPMSTTLPDLTSVSLEDGCQWGVVVTMVTDDENPHHRRFLHANKIVYRTSDAIQITPQSTFIPVTPEELLTSEKKFPRLSIICTKYDQYNFDLMDFEVNDGQRTAVKYALTDPSCITNAAKVKRFIQEYRLFCYRFVFQLAVQMNQSIYVLTNRCESHLVNEERQPKKSGQKRKANSDPPAPTSAKRARTVPVETSSSTRTIRRPRRNVTSPRDHSQ